MQGEHERLHEVVFHDEGDLGIRLDFATSGQVFVKKLEPLIGRIEKACPNLVEGDVLVSIDSTNVVGQTFSDIMKRLRECSKKNTDFTLTFAHMRDAFTSTEKAIEEWEKEEKKFLDDGEFQVVFPASDPLGFRLTESFMMVQLLCLVATKFDILEPYLHHAVVKIDEHVVLTAPPKDVLELVHDGGKFPMKIWLWDFSQETSGTTSYNVVTLSSVDQVGQISFSTKEIMLEVPMVHSIIKPPSSQHILEFSVMKHPLHIQKGQYLIGVNGIPTLTLPCEENSSNSISHIAILHRAMESVKNTVRRLHFRDVGMYQQEMKKQCPLSPWKRHPKQETHHSHSQGADPTIETIPAIFSTLVAKYADATSDTPRIPTRLKQVNENLRHVIVPPSSHPLGIQLETDFTSKYTIFKRYIRPPSRATNVLQQGDRIISINGTLISDIPTDTCIALIRSHPHSRKFLIGRKNNQNLIGFKYQLKKWINSKEIKKNQDKLIH